MIRLVRTAGLALALCAAHSLLAPSAMCQDGPSPVSAPTAYYVEMGGPGLLYSVNVDRRIVPTLGVRAGVSLVPLILGVSVDDRATLFTVPVMAYYLSGAGNSHLEVGVGTTFASAEFKWNTFGNTNETASAFLPTATIGYRYQRPDGGKVFRAGLTPVYIFGEIVPWVGFSFGRTL